MKDQSSTTLEKTALLLTELVQAGPMTVATYMECLHLLGDLLRSSVRTTDETTFQAGSMNFTSRSTMQEGVSAVSFISDTEPPTQVSNSQPSRCQCLCHYCMKQGIHNKKRWKKPNAKPRN